MSYILHNLSFQFYPVFYMISIVLFISLLKCFTYFKNMYISVEICLDVELYVWD